jgi:hypothetical protein
MKLGGHGSLEASLGRHPLAGLPSLRLARQLEIETILRLPDEAIAIGHEPQRTRRSFENPLGFLWLVRALYTLRCV